MVTVINNNLLLTQPYHNSPWNYNDIESVDVMPDSIVDWILVELRSDTSAETAVDSCAGLLTKSGLIIDTSGSGPIRFYVGPADYYLIIYDRNHLPIMSANPYSLNDLSV